jgi:RsmE family RNA methyltransferase
LCASRKTSFGTVYCIISTASLWAAGMKHQFALFYEHTAQMDVGTVHQIADEQLVHRIVHVLRLSVGDQIILFDAREHAVCTLIKSDKKGVHVETLSRETNKIFTPSFVCILPLLKPDALSDAVSHLTAVGINEIQLVTTEKSVQKINVGQLHRLALVMRAAAEQSKQFVIPIVHGPKPLFDCAPMRGILLVLDEQGVPTREIMQKQHGAPTSFTLAVGPEGAFTDDEKAWLHLQGFMPWRLTPTVLRASDAIFLGAGFLRSLY